MVSKVTELLTDDGELTLAELIRFLLSTPQFKVLLEIDDRDRRVETVLNTLSQSITTVASELSAHAHEIDEITGNETLLRRAELPEILSKALKGIEERFPGIQEEIRRITEMNDEARAKIDGRIKALEERKPPKPETRLVQGENTTVIQEVDRARLEEIETRQDEIVGLIDNIVDTSDEKLDLLKKELMEEIVKNVQQEGKHVNIIGGTGGVNKLKLLIDVDVEGITDGQFIAWNATTGKFEPATGGGGAVDSVNGQTGVVVLDADDIDDTSTTNKFVTAADLVTLSNTSGTNTGDVTVTDSSEINFTLTGQDITGSLIAGSIDETKLDASTNASLDLADSATQPGDNVSIFTNDAGYLVDSDFTGGDGITYSSGTISADINTTNLQFTSNEINTIQDIDTTASPTFAGGTFGNITVGVDDDNTIQQTVDDTNLVLKLFDTTSTGEIRVDDATFRVSSTSLSALGFDGVVHNTAIGTTGIGGNTTGAACEIYIPAVFNIDLSCTLVNESDSLGRVSVITFITGTGGNQNNVRFGGGADNTLNGDFIVQKDLGNIFRIGSGGAKIGSSSGAALAKLDVEGDGTFDTGVTVNSTQDNTSTGSFKASTGGTADSFEVDAANDTIIARDDVDIRAALQCDSITNDTGLAAGTYTPTITAVTNVSASTALQCQYMRVGNTVTVSGAVQITATAGGAAATEFEITLPVSSNFGAVEDCGGTFHNGSLEAGSIRADATNDRAQFDYGARTTISQTFYFTFTYQVI